MSFAANLRSLLASGPVVSDRLTQAISLCEQWFQSDATVASYVSLSVLRVLQGWGWDDQQGTSAADYSRFESYVLPEFFGLCDAVDVSGDTEPLGSLLSLVKAFRDFGPAPTIISATP
jgi:hypothetical protein